MAAMTKTSKEINKLRFKYSAWKPGQSKKKHKSGQSGLQYKREIKDHFTNNDPSRQAGQHNWNNKTTYSMTVYGDALLPEEWYCFFAWLGFALR